MKVVIAVCALAVLVTSVPMDKWHRSTDGHSYFIEHEQKFNWFQAWDECRNKNMFLLAPDTLQKQQQVDGLIKQLFPKNITYWLGGNDNAVDKRHVWASTGKVFIFTNWAPGNPNFQTTDHCVATHQSTNQWHDFPCVNKLGFVCEAIQCDHEKTLEFAALPWKDAEKYNVNVWNVFGSHK